jgi:hypothetical protein
MNQGYFSFPGLLYPKELEYTQQLGVRPSIIAMRAIPQSSNIAATGPVTLTYTSAIQLPNCMIDSATIYMDVKRGWMLSVTALDRRWRWSRVPPVSGYYNLRRAGIPAGATQQTLRQLCTLLLTAMGEASANVGAVSEDIYPEVRWNCKPPHLALQELMHEYGYDVALGFDTEAVKVVKLGVGAALGTSGAMMVTSTLDPPTRPQYVRTCFNDSYAQARLKLKAVGMEPDGTWKVPNDLSYRPTAGWEKEDPHTLPTVKATASATAYNAGIKTHLRAYAIDKFADGTLAYPDGSGSLSFIEQLLPLENRLLATETSRSDGKAKPFKVYGKAYGYYKGEPSRFIASGIDDEIVNVDCWLDGEAGILWFAQPMYQTDGSTFAAAELYLECAFRVRHATKFHFLHYEKDVSIGGSGYGYHTVQYPDAFARTVISYGAGQTVSSVTTNQSDLDAIATAVANSVSSQFVAEGGQMVVYCEPNFALRCDGAVHQVKHILSDDTSHPGSYSIASRYQEFDRFILSRPERMAAAADVIDQATARSRRAITLKKEAADD